MILYVIINKLKVMQFVRKSLAQNCNRGLPFKHGELKCQLISPVYSSL